MSPTMAAADTAAADLPFALGPQQGTARIRLAGPADVGQIHRLVQQMAEFKQLTQDIPATEKLLASTLFPTPAAAPPFYTFTVFLVELHPSVSPPLDGASSNPHYHPVLFPATLPPAGSDPDASAFESAQGSGWVTAGYVLLFPNYASFQAEPGFVMEDLFVRGPYRRRGLGKALFGAVATQAHKLGMGGIDWVVLEWNKEAIRFYERMGADVMKGWYHCRLSGSALAAHGGDDGAGMPVGGGDRGCPSGEQ